jgi:peptidoglycan hydrolase-like protein with peptidoglycan-binding domain
MGKSHRHPLRWALCALACTGLAATPLVAASPAVAAHRNAAPRQILRLGATGHLVTKLQHLLGVPADGIFGHGTKRAVRRFQHAHHLLADGQVGSHTWRALIGAHRHHAAGHRRAHDGVLTLGEQGRPVRRVQRMLHIRVNGLYDRRTWRAVRRFQRHHRLLVDGQVGPDTLRALRQRATHFRRPAHAHRTGGLGARAAQLSYRYAGIRYAWGGATPRQGFDCSGLVQYVYGRLGVKLPRVTYDQWHAGRHVQRANLRPGDLVFFHRLGHVGIFLGHGWFMSAPHSGARVHASRLRSWAHYQGAVRIHG